jgi:hypothetical protein
MSEASQSIRFKTLQQAQTSPSAPYKKGTERLERVGRLGFRAFLKTNYTSKMNAQYRRIIWAG